MCTSGTTGAPKIIEKNFFDLLNLKRGSGSADDKWLLTYNPARWAGMSVILHCMKNNCQLIIPKDLSAKSIKQSLYKATHISLTPSLLRKILMFEFSIQEKNIKQITFGGEYVNQSTLDTAKFLFPNARITHIYASTETGDICSCSDGKEGFPLEKIYNFGLSNDGEAVVNGIHTGDYWQVKNNRIIFIGRKDNIINVGGNKVSPYQVETIASSFYGILECKAYGVSNPLLGQVVALDYVGPRVINDVLKSFLRYALPKHAVPMILNKVDSIELTAANKISRQ